MFLYAGAYLILTSPLAIGRMVAMGGNPFSDTYLLVAGCAMTSCGWVDVLMYTYTHRTLVTSTPEVSALQQLPLPPRAKSNIEMNNLGVATTITGGPSAIPTRYSKGLSSTDSDITVPPTAARHTLSGADSDHAHPNWRDFDFDTK
jgi:hypothetical protein